MTFEEYQQTGRLRYLALVDAIENILRHILQQHELTAHAITGRAKELTSLRKKLRDRGIGLEQVMDEIKDLAGCRVVFLTESQVQAFNNTRALHENFEVISVNVHHPVPGTSSETKLFDSTNYLVRLKSERLVLAEYRMFEGLNVEIQIQTLLNHAWAEMGHDTIYKEPKLTHVGTARMRAIGDRMNKVMQDHLIPAGHDFDKIAIDFRRLLKADGIAEMTLKAIQHANNNNDLVDAIKIYADQVLPQYDLPQAQFLHLLETFIESVERSRDLSVVQITTPMGDYSGRSSLDVVRSVADLVRSYRYAEVSHTFRALVRLYKGASDEEERLIWIEAGKEFAGPNLNVWKQLGPAVQQIVLEEVEQLETEAATLSQPLLVAMLAQVLSADMEGTHWRSDSVTFHHGAIPTSDGLRQLRERAISLLEQWLDEAEGDIERLKILRALGRASALPVHNGNDDRLMLMLLEDGARVAHLILARVNEWSLELRRGREVDALRIHNCFHVLPPHLATTPGLAAAQKNLIDALLNLRDKLADDEDYILYKTLVGYDTVRPEAWNAEPFDYRATAIWRLGQFSAIIADVTTETVPDWIARLQAYVSAGGEDVGHFRPMREFLALLAEQKPDEALQMVEKLSLQRAEFLPAMLAGLDRAGRQDEVLTLVDQWLAADRFLPAICGYFQCRPKADLARLQTYLEKAIKLDQQVLVIDAADVAAAWYEVEANPALIETVLMPVIGFAREKCVFCWTERLSLFGNLSIIQALNERQTSDLLHSLIGLRDVDYSAEQLLVAVGLRYPELVIQFFSLRLQYERQGITEAFDAIPFHTSNLKTIFSHHPDLLLTAIRRWYEDEPSLHEFRGGRLLRHAFPELTDEITSQLIELARHGDESDLKFILKTLQSYNGGEGIYPICMEVVNLIEPGGKLLDRVSGVLDQAGMVSGEFGYVEALAIRKNYIELYQDDARPRVKAYADDRGRKLTQQMAWEQRSATRDLAQRRRDWNEE